MTPKTFQTTIISFNSLNFNVKLVFIFSLLQSLGRGIWMGNVLSNWIYLIAGESNILLGLTSAITGLAMTMTVMPAGVLSDRLKRQTILRGASFFGFLGLSFAILAESLEMIFLALLFWGLFQGINRPSVESIFADSVESGNRSKVYAWVHLTRQFGMATGPFVNIGLFFILGDVWELPILKAVMIVGILISMTSLIILLLFRDDRSLGLSSERLEIEDLQGNVLHKNGLVDLSQKTGLKTHQLIIIIMLISNLIIGFGAGMTIKFFPIFFKEIYSLLPIAVQFIMGFTSIFTGLASIAAQKVSVKMGRAEIIFFVQGIATLCLFVISLYPIIEILIPIFLVRGSLMNASQPLSRSILMDVVPKNHRGKINSLQALAWGLFWNVSAAIGGFLIGSDNNFRLCFLITTGVYVLGTAPILLLIPLVGREKNNFS
ncbi:MAG: MFS transporter [Candidatus Hodarchaeales archaeon]